MSYRMSGMAGVILALMLAGCDLHAHDDHDHDHGHGHDHGHAHDQGHHDHHDDHGHDHDDHHHDHDDHLTLTRLSERLLVFIEYDPPVVGHTAGFHVHLTDRATGGAVETARLTLTLRRDDADAVQLVAEGPDEPGIYNVEGRFDAAGAYETRLQLQADDWEATAALGEILVYADDDAAHQALHDQPADAPDAIGLRVEEQWEGRLHSERAERRTLVQRIDAPARVEAAQGHAAVVAAPVEGRVVRHEDDALPRLGERVEAGQPLGWVELTLSADRTAAWAADRASLAATRGEVALRRLDLQRREAEARRALAEAEADLDFHRRTYERSQQMRSEGLATEEEVSRAERDARAAEARYAEAEEVATLYADSRAELDELAEAMAEAAGAFDDSQSLPRMPLRAPIDGRLVEVSAVEGEQVGGGQTLYRILNDEQVWIAARIGEFDLGRLSDAPSARVQLDDGSDRWIALEPGNLVDMTGPVSAQDRTALVRYALDNVDHRLRAGLSATAWIETQRTVDAVAVHEDAVVMDAGRPVVFVQTAGETFERRRVELGLRDGPYVEVRSGVQADEYVVARGAYMVKLAAQEPAEMGHGHVH